MGVPPVGGWQSMGVPPAGAGRQSMGAPTNPWQQAASPQAYDPTGPLGYQASAPDPRRPIGAPPPTPISIDDYRLRGSRAPWIIALVVAVMLGGLLWFGTRSTPSASSATSGQSSSVATPPAGFDPSGNGVAFHSDFDNADGYWQITTSEWTVQGLELNVRIAVTSGTLHFTMFAYDDTTLQDYDPVRTSQPDALKTSTVTQGSTVDGVVIFDKPRGSTSVMLADLRGEPITDLAVKG